MPSGIYRCDIPTNAVDDDNDISVRESVYVGVYATGGIRFLLNWVMTMFVYCMQNNGLHYLKIYI